MRHPTKGNFNGNLIITGSAECLFEDFAKAKQLFENYEIMAVNLSGICFDNIKHLVSLHSDRMKGFLEVAKFRTLSYIHTHSNREAECVKNVWDFGSMSGSSALFATLIAIELGYSKIILCGVPLTNKRRFYDTLDFKSEVGDRATFLGWQMQKDKLKNKVRSLSGRTKELLGEPTKEWIDAQLKI